MSSTYPITLSLQNTSKEAFQINPSPLDVHSDNTIWCRIEAGNLLACAMTSFPAYTKSNVLAWIGNKYVTPFSVKQKKDQRCSILYSVIFYRLPQPGKRNSTFKKGRYTGFRWRHAWETSNTIWPIMKNNTKYFVLYSTYWFTFKFFLRFFL